MNSRRTSRGRQQNMLSRHLAPKLSYAARSHPVVSLTGPRQSGKTTLARAAFPSHDYVNLAPVISS